MKLARILTMTILLFASGQILAQEKDHNHPKHFYGQVGEKKGHDKFHVDQSCDKHDHKKHDHKKCCDDKKGKHKHGAHHGHSNKHCEKHNHHHHKGNACDCTCPNTGNFPKTEIPNNEKKVEVKVGSKEVKVILK